MSASRCRRLPDTQARDSEEKAAYLKAPQNQQVCERVQILVDGPGTSEKESEPRK